VTNQSRDPFFSVGDWVEWSSQAAGYSRTKLGRVIEVVPQGQTPSLANRPKGCGLMSRTVTSYVVLVGRTRKMWPRTQHLRPGQDPKPGRGGPR